MKCDCDRSTGYICDEHFNEMFMMERKPEVQEEEVPFGKVAVEWLKFINSFGVNEEVPNH